MMNNGRWKSLFGQITSRRDLKTFSTKSVIALIPGDGIGKEVIESAHKVLCKAAPGLFEYKHLDAGFECFKKTGKALPEETFEFLNKNTRGALFGATQSPLSKVEGYSSPILDLRKKLDLYANVRPLKIHHGANKKPVDVVIVRENTECVYIKKEWLDNDGVNETAWALRKISSTQSKKIGKFALNLALERDIARKAQGVNLEKKLKPLVTIVHKSNVLNITDGLFRKCIKSVAESDPKYSIIRIEEQIVDSMLYKLIKDSSPFDVIVTPNLYGDLLSDCGAALMGSLGNAGSANVGDNYVLCEPVHGSAPDIAGKGIANPIGAIRSACLLMQNLGEYRVASMIEKAVDELLSSLPPSYPGCIDQMGTEKITDRICSIIDKLEENKNTNL